MSTKTLVFSKLSRGVVPEKQAEQSRRDLEVVYKDLIARIDALETTIETLTARIATLENVP